MATVLNVLQNNTNPPILNRAEIMETTPTTCDTDEVALHYILQPCRKRVKVSEELEEHRGNHSSLSQIPFERVPNKVDLDALESRRQQLQLQLDHQTHPDYRNRHGQYATPPAMAMDVARITLDLYTRHVTDFFPQCDSNATPLCVVDPSCGTGSLLLAMMRVMSERISTVLTDNSSPLDGTTPPLSQINWWTKLRCIGYEKDENVWRRAEAVYRRSSLLSPSTSPPFPLYLYHQDFTTLPTPSIMAPSNPTSSNDDDDNNNSSSVCHNQMAIPYGGADIVLANPPYVRHRHMSLEEKTRLQSLSRTYSGGIQCNKMAGLHCYFMLMMHAHMKPNAIAAWIIPGEFIAVSYASAMRLYLCSNVTLLRIHCFDAIDQQFADAQVSTSIVWYLNRRLPLEQQNTHLVQVTMGGSVTTPTIQRMVPWHRFNQTARDKWNTIFASTVTPTQPNSATNNSSSLLSVLVSSHSTSTHCTESKSNNNTGKTTSMTTVEPCHHSGSSSDDTNETETSAPSWDDMIIDPSLLVMDSTEALHIKNDGTTHVLQHQHKVDMPTYYNHEHCAQMMMQIPAHENIVSTITTSFAETTVELAIGDVFTVKRGIATGYDDFFIMSKQQAVNAHRLPLECLTRLLPNSSEMPSTQYIHAEDPSIRYVVNCDLTMEEIRIKHPTLFSYLQYGVSKLNVPDRYLCKKRQPRWYRQETRTPPPIVVTSRGRISKMQPNPFRFFRNYDVEAIASSHYLQLNLKEPYASMLYKREDVDVLWKCLQQIPIDAMLNHARAYGGGLYDLKPNDLNRILFKIPQTLYNTCHAAAS